MRRRGNRELAADGAARDLEHTELYVPDESGLGVIRGCVAGNVFDYGGYGVGGRLDNRNGRNSELFRGADCASGGGERDAQLIAGFFFFLSGEHRLRTPRPGRYNAPDAGGA